MFNALKILGLTIISPMRGLHEAYSRSQLVPSLILLVITHTLYYFYLFWNVLQAKLNQSFFQLVFQSVIAGFIMSLMIIALFVPVLIAISNFIERRGNLSQIVQQEFSSTAIPLAYAYSAVNIFSLALIALISKGNWAGKLAAISHASFEQLKRDDVKSWEGLKPQIEQLEANPEYFFFIFVFLLVTPLTVLFIMLAIRAAFRMTWLKTIVITACGIVSLAIILAVFSKPIGFLLGSPVLLLLSFFLLQGYFREIAKRRQAQVDFKQSLETATLNPADASAHYNLGLLHQGRNDFEEARKSFEKAVEIDDDEIDAYYQLGKIARSQNNLQDAINHFSQVVSRSPNHAQHEIWREVGATYIAANQFADAKDALDNFLSERPSDPEGLYLLGRAQAGLGDRRAAIATMQACIQAVKTAPTYKNRIEQRWLNEAEKFLKTNA